MRCVCRGRRAEGDAEGGPEHAVLAESGPEPAIAVLSRFLFVATAAAVACCCCCLLLLLVTCMHGVAAVVCCFCCLPMPIALNYVPNVSRVVFDLLLFALMYVTDVRVTCSIDCVRLIVVRWCHWCVVISNIWLFSLLADSCKVVVIKMWMLSSLIAFISYGGH